MTSRSTPPVRPRPHLVRPIFASDVRRLGGVVTVHTCSDRTDGSYFFQVNHTSKGGDCCWRSSRMYDEDQAASAARILAEFVGATVR